LTAQLTALSTLKTSCVVLSLFAALVVVASPATAQTSPSPGAATPLPISPSGGKTPDTANAGQKTAPQQSKPATGTDSTSASKPASAGENSAGSPLKLGPLAPSVAPTDLPKDRPVIGLALGGGGAIAMSEIGVIQWFEEHHIPVDVIAGTSMGSILAALYSTGHSPEDMKHVMTEDSVNSVFRIQQAYTSQSFRRREDSRDLPNSITVGLRHGVSFRNSLLSDNGLNELLDKEFLRYNDQTDFNNLPIPFRCQATDLNAAKTVTFARGSLQDAVRASASIPGVFRPFQLDGHEFVDGAILENLPTPDVKAMHADVILAVSLKLQPVAEGDLNSILGVLSRAFAVGIEANEERDRKLANVVITPDVTGFSSGDYLKTFDLAKRGYAAAEANKAALLQYAVTPAQWQQYLAHRQAKQHGAPGTVLMVKVKAPNDSVKNFALREFAPVVGRPVDTDEVERLLVNLRADGRYDADYTVGYDQSNADQRDRPILLVTVSDKKTGPPFFDIGLNLAAQSGGVTRATVNTILLYQDFGNFGSELRAHIDFGFYTRFEAEYFYKPDRYGVFLAPRAGITRNPSYIYQGDTNIRLSERLLQRGGAGIDAGWGNGRSQEFRAGWQVQNTQWYTTTGADGLPNYSANAQTGRIQYIYDSQDRALVPQYGIHSTSTLGYLYGTAGSPPAPQFYTQIQFARTVAKNNIFLNNIEGGTMFNRNVAQPFRYTLGGPLRLAASAIDQYRGTDYFLVTPGYLRRIRSLPAPLNSSLLVGGTVELGQMRAPDASTITRYDAYFGLVAETPLGVISIAPAFGNGGERKFIFTIGKLF
jgi:NTE family protein